MKKKLQIYVDDNRLKFSFFIRISGPLVFGLFQNIKLFMYSIRCK